MIKYNHKELVFLDYPSCSRIKNSHERRLSAKDGTKKRQLRHYQHMVVLKCDTGAATEIEHSPTL